jgi:hypothetical protein
VVLAVVCCKGVLGYGACLYAPAPATVVFLQTSTLFGVSVLSLFVCLCSLYLFLFYQKSVYGFSDITGLF